MYDQAWHAANRAEILQRKAIRRQATRMRIEQAKDVPCADCGHSYPAWVMDFDHVRGTKAFNLAQAAVLGVSLDRLEREIEKCDVVCSNCHRQRTHDRLIAR